MMHKFKYIIILHRGVTHYDFCKFATILQVATIIFYHFISFLLILTFTPEQFTCTSINTF